MSIRFEEEIEKALVNDPADMIKWRDQFYFDMRMIYNNPKAGQTGMDAIRENMELEIVEIQLLGENFKKDTRIIKETEDQWIIELRNQGEILYNVAGGDAGSTASIATTGYGKRDLHSQIEFLLSHGFKGREIGDYIGLKYGHLLFRTIYEATGMETRRARLYYTGDRMFTLMDDEGILDLNEIAPHFRSMDTNDVFLTLASKHFPMGNEYLKGWLTAKYLQLFSDFNEKDLFEKYLHDLGIKVSIQRELSSHGTYDEFRMQEAIYEHWQRKDYIPLLRFYAKLIVKDHDTIYGFLHHLGLMQETYTSSGGRNIWELESIVIDLLGYDFDIAKDIYKDHYLGRLQILISGN